MRPRSSRTARPRSGRRAERLRKASWLRRRTSASLVAVDRDRARAAVEEGRLAERAGRQHAAARGVQPAVDEQVERAVELALGQDVLPGAEAPGLGVVEQQGPVLLAALLEEAGGRVGGAWLPGYWKKPVVSMVTARSG